MKIAYVTTYPVWQPEVWPRRHLGLYGAGQKIAKLLESLDIDLDYLGPLSKPRTPTGITKLLVYRYLTDKDFYSFAEPSVWRSYGRQVDRKLARSRPDLILCAENAVPIASLRCDRPLVLWTDAMIGSLVGFYSYLDNLCAETRQNLFYMEQTALDRCDRLIVTSQWAAESAMELYSIPAEKIRVIPRGTDRPPHTPAEDVQCQISQRSTPPCRLLFVGVDWKRKGGKLALQIVNQLNQAGICAELHIVGCQPQTAESLPEFIHLHGFIDRSQPAEEARYVNLLKNSHFLLFPTRADTFGNAISEASAYGVPTLATHIGGIPTVVRHGVNGYTFSLDATADDYVAKITHVLTTPGAYGSMAQAALDHFEAHLSSAASRQKVRDCMSELQVAG